MQLVRRSESARDCTLRSRRCRALDKSGAWAFSGNPRAQVAGLGACLLVIDVLGRKKCMLLFLVLSCAFFTPFLRPDGPKNQRVTAVEDAPRGAGQVEAEGSAAGVQPLDIAMLFLSRLSTYAAFIVLFIYTPEVYPTHVRSYAVGLFNALCRLGGLIAPFVADYLFAKVCVRARLAVCCSQQASFRKLHPLDAPVCVCSKACMQWHWVCADMKCSHINNIRGLKACKHALSCMS